MESSLFGRLPGELRNKIWRLLLVVDETDYIDITAMRYPAQPSILATCREIRTETTSIFYSENTFLLCHNLSKEPNLSWLHVIGEARASKIGRLIIAPGDTAWEALYPPVFYHKARFRMQNFDKYRELRFRQRAGEMLRRLEWWGVRKDIVRLAESPQTGRADAAWTIFAEYFEGFAAGARPHLS